nr:hypothetical protein [Tanacetum cinerariifolium]
MEQKNIQDRSVLSIDYHRPFIQVTKYENYLCNLCGNNSHDGYDCQQQFPFVHEQEPSYNQNYDGNYYSHKSPSFSCCDNCGGSHENFQCQPIAQNIDFSGSDQIRTPQYSKIHSPSPKTSDEVFQANHSIQNDESFENSSSNQEKEEPAQESDICQLIREECCVEASEEQKRSMEDTMLELVKIYQEKEFLCIHDDVDDLIESALDSKLLLINSNSQRLDKTEQEVKNVEPEHLLSMGYEHLSITPETESDEVTESKAENLIPIPSKCKVTSEDEIECDMPANDDCSPIFTTFSNPLFKNDDLDFSDDELLPDKDVPAEDFKVYSNPLFDEDKINSDKLDPHFDLFLVSDNSIPPGIENVADDPEGDIRFLEELLIDDSILSHESSNSNFEYNPSIPRPPPEPPDAETDTGEEIQVVS